MSLIESINKRADFAAVVGEQVTKTQLVCILYGLVSNTNQYQKYFGMWCTVEEKTWTPCRAHFIEA